MILHLVTDLRRLAPGATPAAAAEALLAQVAEAVAAGVDAVQLREPHLDVRALTTLARAVVAATRRTRTRVLVNERLDVALATGADGVHLRGSSLDAARVRAVVRPGFLIGRSVHSPDEASASGPVDYLIAGTVWPTASKPDGHPQLGPDGLARVVASSAVPVLAIGGVTLDRVAALASSGAAGCAAIGAWMGAAPSAGVVPLTPVVAAFRGAFDTGNMTERHPSE